MDCLECDCLLSATERGAHVLQNIGSSLRSSVPQGIVHWQFHTAFWMIFSQDKWRRFLPKIVKTGTPLLKIRVPFSRAHCTVYTKLCEAPVDYVSLKLHYAFSIWLNPSLLSNANAGEMWTRRYYKRLYSCIKDGLASSAVCRSGNVSGVLMEGLLRVVFPFTSRHNCSIMTTPTGSFSSLLVQLAAMLT